MTKPVLNSSASKSSHRIPSPNKPLGKVPVAGKTKPSGSREKWCFSLRFWKQIDYFGLGGKDVGWFIALLQRLHQISSESVDGFRSDARKQEVMRYHQINWGQTNIPIQRSDLSWLPTDYRENEVEYPFYQFSISTSRGRIAGFWEENIFNIVLIDPYHNLQPDKEHDYKTTPTLEQLGDFELLLARLNRIYNAQPTCSSGNCSTQTALKFVELHDQDFGIVYIDAEYFKMAKELIKTGKVRTIAQLVELGIVAATA
jgi:hypothetical protein